MAELSDDGRLAYYERFFDGAESRFILVVADLESGEELFRQDLNRPDQGWSPKTIDLLGNQVIVNRTESGLFDAPFIEALVIDLDSGAVTEVVLAGHTRFFKGPMGID